MRIKKTSQYIEGGASLSNTYGESNENGYTQEYINNNLNKVKVVELRTPTADSGIIANYNGSRYIIGFQVYAFGQWRNGSEVGTLASAENNLYYIVGSSQTSQYLDKPIRIYYI